MIKLAITGCQGRMGQRIAALAGCDSAFEISALVERPDHPDLVQSIGGVPVSTSIAAAERCDMLIDFTSPEGTMGHLDFCREHGVKMVIGTTGLSKDQEARIQEAASRIPIVYGSNMSVGVNILFKLTEMLAVSTPADYVVRMKEAHHIHKKDAPSGTAKTLAGIIQAVSSKDASDIESIREGEIVGDHELSFESAEDVITIRHHAKSRDIFVKGALEAAKFLMDKTPGLFSMQDVLGLNT